MGDAAEWFSRLEKVSLCQCALAIVASLGAPQQSYNVSLSLFLLYSSYARSGRINAVSGILSLFSLVMDISLLSMYGEQWSDLKHEYALSMAMIIINLFIKSFAIFIIFLIYGELGLNHSTAFYLSQSMAAGHGLYNPVNNETVDEFDEQTDRAVAIDGVQPNLPQYQYQNSNRQMGPRSASRQGDAKLDSYQSGPPVGAPVAKLAM